MEQYQCIAVESESWEQLSIIPLLHAKTGGKLFNRTEGKERKKHGKLGVSFLCLAFWRDSQFPS